MPKPNTIIHGDTVIDPLPMPSYAKTPGMMIAGQSYIDEVDLTAANMERKWGVGRLRLLVGLELREKFDRQRYLFNQAIWHGDIEAVRREAKRMVTAWEALDREAVRQGAGKLACEVWEVGLPDGTVAAIVNHEASGWPQDGDGRAIAVYTLEEIGNLLAAFPNVAKAKETFPGATVTAARKTIGDALDGMIDSSEGLDEEFGG